MVYSHFTSITIVRVVAINSAKRRKKENENINGGGGGDGGGGGSFCNAEHHSGSSRDVIFFPIKMCSNLLLQLPIGNFRKKTMYRFLHLLCSLLTAKISFSVVEFHNLHNVFCRYYGTSLCFVNTVNLIS